jgi:hypothetical protein
MCTQAIFELLDLLTKWVKMEEVTAAEAAARKTKGKDRSQEERGLREKKILIESVPRHTLARASYGCKVRPSLPASFASVPPFPLAQAHTRALKYFELHLRDKRRASQKAAAASQHVRSSLFTLSHFCLSVSLVLLISLASRTRRVGATRAAGVVAPHPPNSAAAGGRASAPDFHLKTCPFCSRSRTFSTHFLVATHFLIICVSGLLSPGGAGRHEWHCLSPHHHQPGRANQGL